MNKRDIGPLWRLLLANKTKRRNQALVLRRIPIKAHLRRMWVKP